VSTQLVAHSQAVLARHGRSFRFASFFLPRGASDDAAVVYAFCREVDDAIDEAPSSEDGRVQGQALVDELAGAVPARPSVAMFLDVAARRFIDLVYPRELCAGVLSDVGPVRIADTAELLRYCYRVAGTVGGMMCGVLGVVDSSALPHAIDLGIAMQLTNICRDVKEDAARDRVYLPASMLDAHGVAQSALLDGVRTSTVDDATRAGVRTVTAELLALAERYYASGRAGMRYIPLRSRMAILVAARVYRAIGLELLARGGDPLQGRVVVGGRQKVGEAVRALAQLLRPDVLGLGAPTPHDASLHMPLHDAPGAHRALAA
jgi:phytoene synthase